MVKVAIEGNYVHIYLTRGIGDSDYEMARDRRPIWCHLSVISGTTPHSG